MLSLTYETEPRHVQDYLFASTRVAALASGTMGQIKWGVVVGGIVAAATVLIEIIPGQNFDGLSFGIGAWFFWLINYVTTIYVTRRISAQKFKDNGLVLGKRTSAIDHDGFHETGQNYSSTTKWGAFRSITAEPLVLVLWTEAHYGYFVPRSAFQSREEEMRFISVVQEKLKT